VIARFAGEEVARQLTLEIIPFDAGRPVFEVLEKGRRLRASNGATLAKAFYTDVTRKGAGVCSWSGNRFDANVWKNGTPNDDLRTWIAKARSCADGDEKLADYYETDARRIITVWAPGLGDYAARVWSGLVANYYLPRLRLARAGKAKEIHAWQNKWVEERLPIAPPASGWTCEKLVDEIVKAALTLENQGGR